MLSVRGVRGSGRGCSCGEFTGRRIHDVQYRSEFRGCEARGRCRVRRARRPADHWRPPCNCPTKPSTYHYQRLLRPAARGLDAARRAAGASTSCRPTGCEAVKQQLMQVRSQVAAERELQQRRRRRCSRSTPASSTCRRSCSTSTAGRATPATSAASSPLANRLREEVDRVVVLGIGGSYLGAAGPVRRALPAPTTTSCPPKTAAGHAAHLLRGQQRRQRRPPGTARAAARTPASIRSCARSAGASSSSASRAARWRRPPPTASSAASWRSTTAAARERLQAADRPGHRRRRASCATCARPTAIADDDILTIPDDVGGRFSRVHAGRPAAGGGDGPRRAGPAARRRGHDPALPRGAVRAQPGPAVRRRQLPDDRGAAARPIRVLSIWSKKLEAVGLWYDQLLAESLGKQGRGPTPLTAVQTRDLHSPRPAAPGGHARQAHQQPGREDAASTRRSWSAWRTATRTT